MSVGPKVSVIMPAYNVERYVAEAIESILNQTFSDFEFIIINDGSTDKTADIIQEYAERDKRIRFVNNTKNSGFIASLNECLDLARGEYVAKMDSDDISLPTRLEKQVAFLDNHPDYGMVGCSLESFGKRNFVLRHRPNVCISDFLYGCMTTVFMARRDIIEKHHLRFDSGYFAAEDYEFYSRFVQYAKIYNIQEVLYRYRIHSTSVSEQKQQNQIATSKHIQQDIANFLFSEQGVKDRFVKMYRWFRICGIPLIKIKTYNLRRTKYYLFGLLPLALVEDGKFYLFGFFNIGKIK